MIISSLITGPTFLLVFLANLLAVTLPYHPEVSVLVVGKEVTLVAPDDSLEIDYVIERFVRVE